MPLARDPTGLCGLKVYAVCRKHAAHFSKRRSTVVIAKAATAVQLAAMFSKLIFGCHPFRKTMTQN